MSHAEELVQRRQAAFDYLKRAHRGEAFYLNSIRLRPAELSAHAQTTDPARNVRFLTLGLSVGRLLEGAGGAAAVRAFAQMMEEFEYHVASAAAQSMKYLRAKNRISKYAIVAPSPPDASAASGASAAAAASQANELDEAESLRPALWCYHKTVIYDYLVVPPPSPHELDYISVVNACCDVFSALYAKFVDPSLSRAAVYQALLRVDAVLQDLFIEPVVQGLSTVAAHAIARELRGVSSSFYASDNAFSGIVNALDDESARTAEADR